MKIEYNDYAIPLAWPEKTAYGDEKWMAFLKNIGVVKNLHFKVGHAAIILIERKSGVVKYFDFGRYITPRGYGRARSDTFDPRLTIYTKAIFDDTTSEILNIEEIIRELVDNEEATHGGGKLLYTIAENINFNNASKYAETLVLGEPILYGALATNNNSCSRYVAQIVCAGMHKSDHRKRKILYPENLKSSPTSNVVNASPDGHIFIAEDDKIARVPMNRMQSLKFQWSLISENLSTTKSKLLSDDTVFGHIEEPLEIKSDLVPKDAQWLGGIGEGIWLNLIREKETYYVECYLYTGKMPLQVTGGHPSWFRSSQRVFVHVSFLFYIF